MRTVVVMFVAFALLLGVIPVSAQSDEVTVAQVFAVENPPGYRSYVGWSPDGTLIAINFYANDRSEQFRQIYDVATGDLLYEIVYTISDLTRGGPQFIWYADSTRLLIQASVDAPAQIVDARTGSVLATLEDIGPYFEDDLIEDMIFNRDEAGTLRVYDAQSGSVLYIVANVSGFLVYSPDKTKFAITVADSGIEVYDTASFTLLEKLDNYRVGNEYEGDWSPDGTQLVVVPFYSTYRTLGPRQLWTIGEKLLSAPIYNLTSRITWSPDLTQIGAASDFTKLRIYDAYTGELINTIRGLGDGPITGFFWGERFLVADNGHSFNNTPSATINVWDFQRGEVVLNIDNYQMASYRLNNEIIEIYDSWDGNIRKIDLTTGETVFEHSFDELLRISPDEQWYLTDNTHFEEGIPVSIYVYEADSVDLVATLAGHTEMVNLFWSPDSLHFASVGGPGIVIVWKVQRSE